VPDYLIQCNVLWHLSLREGLPRSVVQALACGKPAFGYALDGTPEVILNGETGYCTAAKAYDVIAEKTVELYHAPALMQKMGENGRNLVQTRFDKDRMAEILLDEYSDILERKRLNQNVC
jgi:glycosyltransferase involved in cell wall biosynthesis